ncbi:alginate biosynthesis protein AlgX, partial [Pseudomonas sp. NPDC087598]|uniref:alginate biosynthesis protein AlgX n=1 Tax=Pseudomonas sp. NPDC087598 TaxID=3364440 RepID=UPI0038054916
HEDSQSEKPAPSDTDARFAIARRTDAARASQNLLAVEVQGPEAGTAPQKVEAKICKRNVFPGAGQQTAQVGQ